ncbi:MAG: FAD:protein FMN transferase, partial [Treponema sp.]|nr:FAD:protein FMN transferase [Treponema sp.]
QITAAPNESKTVVTSGTYERYFENDGIRYHHLFNPPLGYPAQNGLISVTVTADVSMDADALSTAVFVLGFEKGFALIESLDGIEAVFVFEDRSVRTTAGADFTLTDKTYFIKK